MQRSKQGVSRVSRQLTFAILALALVAATQPATAREGAWTPLGEQTVSLDVDRDVIRVGRERGLFSRIRLDVSGDDIFLYGLRVRYENGTEESFAMGRPIRAGSGSQPIDLTGEARAIREIELTYRAREGRGRARATVTVLGEEARAGDRGFERADFAPIDRQTADRRDERIVFRTERGEGRLGLIRLDVVRGPIRLNRVDVRFANGDRQSFEIGDRLEDGDKTRPLPIDLTRERRRVDEVVVIQRPGVRPGRIELELTGLKTRSFDEDRERPRDWDRDRDRDRDVRGGAVALERGAPGGGWVLFGSQTVGFGVERDVIRVGRDAGLFEKIALRVLKNDIYLREVDIVFGNGERQRVPVNVELKEGFRTAPLPLERGDRFIEQIELIYQAKPDRRGQAVVEVYGDYSDKWLRDADQRRGRSDGWVLLGAQRAEMFNSDRDSFEVGERFGRFKALRISAKKSPVKIRGMRVIYGNGEAEEVPISVELRDGQATDALTINGRGRFIQRVELKYRTKLNFKGEGVVEVWGLQ